MLAARRAGRARDPLLRLASPMASGDRVLPALMSVRVGQALVLVAAAGLLLTGLDGTGLWAPDEPRYAAVAEELRAFPGIAYAVSSEDLRAGAVASTPVTDAVLANFNEDRSGDIYVVFEPHWFVADFDGLTVTGSHGSPWRYDTNVPIIWMGPGVPQGRIGRRVETVDVAPTISAYLGVKYPSGTRGRVMTEIME